ncbi:MAG: hypothetical protein FWD23_12765, partial [Oscillospiraceae bacterium]|nr:hypothetical protein [Oscillospiraceae bacterium]
LKLSENPVAALKNKAGSGLKISADDLENIWVSNYKKDGKGVYFVVNTSPEANKIDLSGNGGFSVIINQTGDIIRSAEKTQFGMDGYTSLVVVSQ